jgi:hypothetical protein
MTQSRLRPGFSESGPKVRYRPPGVTSTLAAGPHSGPQHRQTQGRDSRFPRVRPARPGVARTTGAHHRRCRAARRRRPARRGPTLARRLSQPDEFRHPTAGRPSDVWLAPGRWPPGSRRRAGQRGGPAPLPVHAARRPLGPVRGPQHWAENQPSLPATTVITRDGPFPTGVLFRSPRPTGRNHRRTRSGATKRDTESFAVGGLVGSDEMPVGSFLRCRSENDYERLELRNPIGIFAFLRGCGDLSDARRPQTRG